MKKLKIYLDTSIISFLYAEDSPDYKKATIDFFNNYLDQYDVYITEFVLAELDNTKDQILKDKLVNAVSKYNLKILDIAEDKREEIVTLAKNYIANKVIPVNKIDDAIHIAICSIYDFDILLSWNFKHIANIKKQIQINMINMREGFLKELYLINPLEVIYDKE